MLNTAQLATFRSAILAENDPTIIVAREGATRNDSVIAAFYNAASATIVWRTNIKSKEVIAAITPSELKALIAQTQNLLIILLLPGEVDASAANVRANFAAVFAAGTSLTALTALAKRPASRVEALFAVGAGTTANPSVMGFEGTVALNEVSAALNS